MKRTEFENNIRKTAFFTTVAVLSTTIQMLAQNSYPVDDSATKSNIQRTIDS